ncbi:MULTISPECIES: hypothetical protein [unclassified Streptomyces]|uniref:hypothetical protein n=1 Tax=Streptomycetaceae TaxID=2062 RepID=UPI002E7A2470|nr:MULTISPECIES: hypothetical protein [unclassified Streptomyces]MED7952250.1 hypothetical protein [Streptomyces sp. BE303]MEE1826515.1 hypothetical protein [Streptomyces sp. BE20]
MDTRQDDMRRDLDASLQARKELGKEYESELVDSFLSRIDARLDARVERRVAERLGPAGGYDPAEGHRPHGPGRRPHRPHGSGARVVPIVSMALGIPLSGIAGGTSGIWGLVVCWAGIVGVNVSAALAERRLDRAERRAAESVRSDWD